MKFIFLRSDCKKREANIRYLLTISQLTVISCLIISSIEIVQYIFTKRTWIEFIKEATIDEDETEHNEGYIIQIPFYSKSMKF